MLKEGEKQANALMERLGYDIGQTGMKAVPEFGLPELPFPGGGTLSNIGRRRTDAAEGLAALLDDDHECVTTNPEIPLHLALLAPCVFLPGFLMQAATT